MAEAGRPPAGVPINNRVVREGYSGDWDTFIQKLTNQSPKRRASTLNEAVISGRLSMILSLAHDVIPHLEGRMFRPRDRFHERQRRILRERGMTLQKSALRHDYLDRDTRAMLPPIALHPPLKTGSGGYFSRWEISLRNNPTRIAKLLAERESGHELHRLMHPTGGPVSQQEIDRLVAEIHTMLPTYRKVGHYTQTAGITRERALEIALASRERRGR